MICHLLCPYRMLSTTLLESHDYSSIKKCADFNYCVCVCVCVLSLVAFIAATEKRRQCRARNSQKQFSSCLTTQQSDMCTVANIPTSTPLLPSSSFNPPLPATSSPRKRRKGRNMMHIVLYNNCVYSCRDPVQLQPHW